MLNEIMEWQKYFQVSVIIPVFNAEHYVEFAVKSALRQPEVFEVILIEDGSTDNSLQVCRELSLLNEKVKLIRHPDGRNHGAGASRNVGIQNACSEYIAFLDADDFYLPNRFHETKDVFSRKPDADGVYEAIGVHHYNESGRQMYQVYSGGKDMTTVSIPGIPPESLFEILTTRKGAQFSLDGFTLKKRLIDKTGYFDTELKQTQDTDFIWRASFLGRLYPGSVQEPVAKRGIHGHNRVFDRKEALFFRRKMADKWFSVMLCENWKPVINRSILRRKLNSAIEPTILNRFLVFRLLSKAILSIILLFRYPALIGKIR